jgi:hypothetical protein
LATELPNKIDRSEFWIWLRLKTFDMNLVEINRDTSCSIGICPTDIRELVLIPMLCSANAMQGLDDLSTKSQPIDAVYM